MKWHSHHLALAGSLTAGLWYSVKAVLLLYARDYMLKMHAQTMHLSSLDFMSQYIDLSWKGVLMGLAHVMIWTYLVLWTFGLIYRHLCSYYDASCNPGMGNNNKSGCCK